MTRHRFDWTLRQSHPGAAIHIRHKDGQKLPPLIGELTEDMKGEDLDRLMKRLKSYQKQEAEAREQCRLEPEIQRRKEAGR